jgi:hypothetical protein
MTTTATLTFDELAKLEPGLRRLEFEILRCKHAHRRKRNLCGNGIWYGYGRFPWYRFKSQMSALVGWGRLGDPDNPDERILKSEAAYATAYEHLYELLPHCRNCACL